MVLRFVDAGLLHPLEVSPDGLTVVTTENFGGLTIGKPKLGRIKFVRIVLGNIWPQVNRRAARPHLRPVVTCPVRPAKISTIGRAVEPALVATHYFASQRGSIDGNRILIIGT